MKALIIIFVLLFATAAAAGSLYALRGPIFMDYGASPLLGVTFNHSSHKRVKCRTCHHMEDAQGQRYIKCTREECHSIKGGYKSNPMSAFMAYHALETERSCYGCHFEKRARHASFRGCQPCHMGPETREAVEKARAERKLAKQAQAAEAVN